MTLENAIKIGKIEDIESDIVQEPSEKIIQRVKNKNDSQSSVNNQMQRLAPAGISIDSVSGLISPGVIPTGQLVTFYLHLRNTFGEPMYALSNMDFAFILPMAPHGMMSVLIR